LVKVLKIVIVSGALYLSEQPLFSNIVVHLQATILLVVAVVGIFVQVFHRRSRQQLRLQHIPGTLASAISIGAESNLAQLLNSQQEENLDKALSDKQFRIDPRTMKILVERRGGYEETVSPTSCA
jgi:hypothetical protein